MNIVIGFLLVVVFLMIPYGIAERFFPDTLEKLSNSFFGRNKDEE